MVLEGELPQGEEEQLAPPGVLAGGELEDDRHDSADILDADGLRVEVGEDRGFVEKRRRRGGRAEGVLGRGGVHIPLRTVLSKICI